MTSDTIVVYQTFSQQESREAGATPDIPGDVFRNLNLVKDGTALGFTSSCHLTKELLYDKVTSEIHLGENKAEQSESEQEHLRYLRVYTLNYWYQALATCLLRVALAVSDLSTTLMLCASLVSDTELRTVVGPISSTLFINSWFIVLLVQAILAYCSARHEWGMKANHKVGDLITDLCPTEIYKTFLAMVFFAFFYVEKQIKDIVIYLHPFKNVQIYSALKCEGHRVHFVGFRSKLMFRIENTRDMEWSIPIQVVMKILVLGFKIWMFFWQAHANTFSLPVLVSLATSIPSSFWLFSKWWRVKSDRKKFRAELRARIARLKKKESTGELSEQSARELAAEEKLLLDQFQERPSDQGGFDKTPRSPKRRSICGECPRCGRLANDCRACQQDVALPCAPLKALAQATEPPPPPATEPPPPPETPATFAPPCGALPKAAVPAKPSPAAFARSPPAASQASRCESPRSSSSSSTLSQQASHDASPMSSPVASSKASSRASRGQLLSDVDREAEIWNSTAHRRGSGRPWHSSLTAQLPVQHVPRGFACRMSAAAFEAHSTDFLCLQEERLGVPADADAAHTSHGSEPPQVLGSLMGGAHLSRSISPGGTQLDRGPTSGSSHARGSHARGNDFTSYAQGQARQGNRSLPDFGRRDRSNLERDVWREVRRAEQIRPAAIGARSAVPHLPPSLAATEVF